MRHIYVPDARGAPAATQVTRKIASTKTAIHGAGSTFHIAAT